MDTIETRTVEIEPPQIATEGNGPVPGPRSLVLQTVLLLSGIFFLSCVSRFGMGPLMPAIEVDLGIGHAAAGTVVFATALGYCLGLLASGSVSSRLNYRRTVIVSLVAVGVALIGTALGEGLLALCIGMALVGFGGGIYLPSGLATISSLVPSTNWGKAFSVHELAPNISFMVAPLVVEAFLGWLSWRGVLVILGILAVAGGMVFAWSGRGSVLRGTPLSPAGVKAALANPSQWLLTLLFSLALGANVGVYMMLPLYLVSDLGFDRGWANTLIGYSRTSGLVVVLASGLIADRWGARRTITLVLGVTGVLTALLGVLSGPWLLVDIFLQPMFVVCFFPVGFSVLSRVGPLAVSLCVPAAFLLGAGAIPAAMGAMAAAGYFAGAMMLMGVLTGAGAALAWFVSVAELSRSG